MDVIIILGAVIGRDGYPGRVARFRLQHALPLVIETYPASRVVISGGVLPGRPVSEAKAMGDWAVRRALEHWGEGASQDLEQRLLPDEVSMNTAATAQYTAVLMQERGWKIAGLITDTLHMPRVEYLFKRTFLPQQLEFRPLPAPGLWQDYWQRRRYLRLSKFVLREAGAWVKAWGRGVLPK
jgi:uncharacterized SAM-binding protein YcdF (DUF218 family)